jgi:adenylate cyclase
MAASDYAARHVSGPEPQRRSARAVAAARRLNRHPRLLAVAKSTRERWLGDEQHVDRLSTARGRPADLAARELAALRAGAPGVLGELGLTALQAWQALSERQGRGRGELDVAILFTDLAGFSSWALEAGDTSAIALLREVSEAVEPPILRRRGDVVKRLGDGLMAAFWDAQGAVEAAFAAARRVSVVEAPGYHAQLRAGIHLGRPRRIGGDYFGVDVNIAARLVEAAGPGEVLVSDRTLRAIEPSAVRASTRELSLKGAPEGLVVHALAPVGDALARP